VMETPENVVDEDGGDELGNTPEPVAWSPHLASFPPLVLILATSSSKLSLSSCGGGFLVNDVGRMICSMWRRTEEEAINRRTPRAKGAPNRARSGQGRSAQAGRPRPISAQFGPRFLPGFFSCDSLFACTCMWAFDVVSFTVKA
jgi:hypothetical protein